MRCHVGTRGESFVGALAPGCRGAGRAGALVCGLHPPTRVPGAFLTRSDCYAGGRRSDAPIRAGVDRAGRGVRGESHQPPLQTDDGPDTPVHARPARDNCRAPLAPRSRLAVGAPHGLLATCQQSPTQRPVRTNLSAAVIHRTNPWSPPSKAARAWPVRDLRVGRRAAARTCERHRDARLAVERKRAWQTGRVSQLL